MRVVISGGGIGGLALARGLQRRDIEVVVLERDEDLRRTGGFGLHLRAPAVVGLYEMLPQSVLARLHAVSQGPWNQHGFAVRDHRGHLLAVERAGTTAGTLDVDRVTLRLLLADGLGDRLVTGTRVLGYRLRRGGGAVAMLDDGAEVDGDVLVAADGVGSAITTALAGRPTADPTALVGIAGRTAQELLAPATREMLGHRATLAVGPAGTGLYAGHHAPLPGTAASGLADTPGHPGAGYVWGVIATRPGSGPVPAKGGAPALADAADVVSGWAAELRDLVDEADADGVVAARLHASPLDPSRIAPWDAGPVTGIGDAVHAMPPTGGQGASTAIRDAHVLLRELLHARDGRKSVAQAVGDYQDLMRGYAARAVAESLQPVTWTEGGGDDVGSVVARVGLPAEAAVAWVRRGDPAPV